MAKKKVNKLPVADYPSPCAPVKRTKEDEERERRYRAEDALRSLQRAEEVKTDKALMRDVKLLAKEQMEALGKIK